MPSEMTEEQYCSERDRVLNKFKKEFREKHYREDIVFHSIVEQLIRNVNPYTIIEQLCTERGKLIKEMSKMIEEKIKL